MPDDRDPSAAIPQALRGAWRVASFRDPDGSGGPTPDTWTLRADRVEMPEATFEVAAVTARVEEGQDLHLLTFANNKLQFALIRSESRPGALLVVWYLSGREVRRFLLQGPV